MQQGSGVREVGSESDTTLHCVSGGDRTLFPDGTAWSTRIGSQLVVGGPAIVRTKHGVLEVHQRASPRRCMRSGTPDDASHFCSSGVAGGVSALPRTRVSALPISKLNCVDLLSAVDAPQGVLRRPMQHPHLATGLRPHQEVVKRAGSLCEVSAHPSPLARACAGSGNSRNRSGQNTPNARRREMAHASGFVDSGRRRCD